MNRSGRHALCITLSGALLLSSALATAAQRDELVEVALAQPLVNFFGPLAKNHAKQSTYGLLAGLLLGGVPGAVQGQEPYHGTVGAWVSTFGGATDEVFQTSARRLDTVSLFALDFTPDGHLRTSSTEPHMRQLLRTDSVLRGLPSPRPSLFLSVTNDVVGGPKPLAKDSTIVHQAIGSAEARHRHIQELLTALESFGADGIEIDYERVSLFDRQNFTAFIHELAAALHAPSVNKQLRVVVNAKTQDTDRGQAAAMDYGALAESADRLVIMAYYLHTGRSSPGPSATIDWIHSLITYAHHAGVAPDKLEIALSLVPIGWPIDQNGLQTDAGQPIRPAQFDALAGRIVKSGREDDVPFFIADFGPVRWKVFYQDSTSIASIAAKAQALGLKHLAYWLGYSLDVLGRLPLSGQRPPTGMRPSPSRPIGAAA